MTRFRNCALVMFGQIGVVLMNTSNVDPSTEFVVVVATVNHSLSDICKSRLIPASQEA